MHDYEIPPNLRKHAIFLRFIDKVTEKEFNTFCAMENVLFLRAKMALSFLSWIATLLLVYTVYPHVFAKWFFAVILSVLPMIVTVLIATFHKRFIGWLEPMAAAVNAVAGVLVVMCTWFFIQNHTVSTLGTIIIIFYASLIMRLKMIHLILATLTYIVLFEILLLCSPQVPVVERVVYSFTVLLFEFGSIYGAFVNESLLRNRFIQKKIIDKQNDEKYTHIEKLATLGTVVAGVAHEINNPNNSIMLDAQTQRKMLQNMINFIDDSDLGKEDFAIGDIPYGEFKTELEQSSGRIVRNSQRINRIAGDLRSISKKGVEMNEPVEFNNVINSAIAVIDHIIKKSTRFFTVTLEEPLPIVSGNSQYLEQVVINILKNACQALSSPDKGISITSAFNSKSKEVLISVHDEGKGMDEETLKNVWTPFYTTKGAQGTGLGLSICNNIIKSHGGRIEIQSEPGSGTTIHVFLPAKNPSLVSKP